MQKTLSIRVHPSIAAQDRELRRYIVRELGIDARSLSDFRIRKRSIDARQRTVFVNLTMDIYINEPAPQAYFEPIFYPDVSEAPRVVVVGAGPGGLLPLFT